MAGSSPRNAVEKINSLGFAAAAARDVDDFTAAIRYIDQAIMLLGVIPVMELTKSKLDYSAEDLLAMRDRIAPMAKVQSGGGMMAFQPIQMHRGRSRE